MAQWRPIPGYEKLYKISDEGQILPLCDEGIPSFGRRDYGFTVTLRQHNTLKVFSVHRLLLLAFHPLPAGNEADLWITKCQSDNPHNLSLDNWAWVRRQTNRLLTEDAVREIKTRWLADPTLSCAAIARDYGVSRSAISHIVNEHNWAWVK